MPKTRLRPTASTFTPRTLSTASSISFPTGSHEFTFNIKAVSHRGMQYGSSLDSNDKTGPVEGVAVKSEPGDKIRSSDQDHASSGQLQGKQDKLAPGAASHTIKEASQPSATLESDEDSESDLPTARPFFTSGREEYFSSQQQSRTAHGSPAAEIHGIFASPDQDSSASSDISDSMEVLSDSFDPVSYSHETDTESTYEISSTAIFLSSTPRGGLQVLPMHSDHSSSESGCSSPQEFHTVPTLNVDQDPRRRFMEWTFPSPGHGRLPSISRRHTFDHLDSPEDESAGSSEHGVATTFASRVGALRAHLAGRDHLRVTSDTGRMVSTRSSAEFPMRRPTAKLTVMNDSGEAKREVETDITADRDELHDNNANDLDESLAQLAGQIGDVLKTVEGKVSSDPLEEVLTSSARPAPGADLSPLYQMLEQQSILLSSLASITQQNREHQNHHLIPFLEGQQAVLDKISTVENRRSQVSDLLERLEQQQGKAIIDLQSQLASSIMQKEELASQVHRLQLKISESEHVEQAIRNEAGETRDRFNVAQSRNAALELHLQSLIKEKQSTARETEEDQATRQRQQALYEKTSADLEAKHQDLIVERLRNETFAETIRLQTVELIGLRQSTSAFQDALVYRLSRIEEGVQGSASGSEEYIRLQNRNEQLQGEVDSVKEQVSLCYRPS